MIIRSVQVLVDSLLERGGIDRREAYIDRTLRRQKR